MERRRPPRLSLDLLRGFRAAARHPSFTRAARELHVTQPAISREIKALETQLGQPLFLRANRTLTLTQAGEQLYRASDDALALIDAAAERISGGGGALSVTTTTALASLWLVPRLARFTRRHPDIDVRIAASNDTVDIEREHLDLAIRYVRPGRTHRTASSSFPIASFRSALRRCCAVARAACAPMALSPGTCGSTSRRSCTAGPGTTGRTGSTGSAFRRWRRRARCVSRTTTR